MINEEIALICFMMNLKVRLAARLHDYLQNISLLLSKMVLFDEQMYERQENFVIAGAILIVAFKIIDHIEKLNNFEMFVFKLFLFTFFAG